MGENNSEIGTHIIRPSEKSVFLHFCGVFSNLDLVKQLLLKEPKLINATWDWGGGDWETALGGAAHTRQQEMNKHVRCKAGLQCKK